VPTNESTLADEMNTVSAPSSFVLKATCFLDEKAISGLVEKNFTKEEPVGAVEVKNPKPGLAYNYFEGKWSLLPVFSTLKPMAKGVVEKIDLTMKKRNEDYSVVYTGYIQIPETGVYQFLLTSDDGSKMTIAGKTTLNDGLHAMETKTMDIALEQGLHPIEIQFFQASGGEGLKVEWKASGKGQTEIDKSLIFN